MEESRNNNASIKSQLYEKEQTVTNLVEKNSLNTDPIAALSDQVMKLMEEIERLKKERTNNNETTHDNNNKLE